MRCCKKMLAILFILLSVFYFVKIEALDFSPTQMNQFEKQYGPAAQKRLQAWFNLINQNQDQTELKKLDLVNTFFMGFEFVSDATLWNQENYWATPFEFIGKGGGDCEDFVIAKYFTLRALGVNIEKLRLTYVTSAQLTQAHMVLAYYAQTTDDPLILDNLTPDILPASQRTDLKPVYFFNGENVWLIKEKQEKYVGKSKQMLLWKQMLMHMQQSGYYSEGQLQ